ncbi:MAG: T9SS type A sorting domain-containing protein [Bacteroidetes bacterium]|nr:T9SS type A sorting domain-containing protein [Bacteroidota bacterium]
MAKASRLLRAIVSKGLASAGVRMACAVILMCTAWGMAGVTRGAAQTIVTREVIAGGGGTASSPGHIVNGTISQTAAGRMVRKSGDLHDVGFWYQAYRPEVVTKVSIPHIDAEVGTHITVPLQLTVSQTQGPFGPRPFQARIRFNHTLLHAAGSTPACTYDGDDCAIEITGIANDGQSVIAQLDFVVALGDSESTPIAIDDFQWQQTGEERIATVREDGALQLLGVCRAGNQIRLIRSGAFASRINVWPNPASRSTTVEYVSAEAGPLDVRIVDMLGDDVAHVAGGDAEAEKLYRQEVDLTGISSGSYVVVFTTPTGRFSQPLLITQ